MAHKVETDVSPPAASRATPGTARDVTFRTRLHPSAKRDFEQIESCYDAEAPHQPDRFVAEFNATLEWLTEYAALPAIDELGIGHVSTGVFKYHVWYRILSDSTTVQVLADLHHARDPDEIRRRSR